MAEMSRRTKITLEQQAAQCMLCYDAPCTAAAGWVQTLPQWCGVSALKTFPGQRRQ